MNQLNRIITLLSLLIFIACAGLTAINTLFATLPPLPGLRTDLMARLSALVTSPETMTLGQRLPVVAGALVVAFLLFLLLVIEVRGFVPKKEENVRVRGADGSETVIARSAILQRVHYEVDRVDDVVEARPRIEGKADGLTVHLDVTTTPFVDVPLKTEEIRAVTREVVESKMGLVLKKVTVKLDHEKFRDAATPSTSL